jgi:hypothetical protein
MCGVLCAAAASDCSGMNISMMLERNARIEMEFQKNLNKYDSGFCSVRATLQMYYGESVTVRELVSIATVAAHFSRVQWPGRAQKRSLVELTGWYRDNRAVISPFLPLIQLRDKDETVIRG